MKKFFILLVAALMPVIASAQAQIYTKKMKIANFPTAVTKVVLTGNAFYDEAFKQEMAAIWKVSPHAFCTLEEFEQQKVDPNSYFLMITQGQFKKEKEPGIQFLTLVKGGPEATKGINEMIEVTNVPFAAADSPTGREIVYLPALLNIIQNYALESTKKDLYMLGGISNFATTIHKTTGKKIVFAKEDICTEIAEELSNYAQTDEGISVLDIEDSDDLAVTKPENTMFSYVVAPTEPKSGSFCYKLMIDTNTKELIYLRKHRITSKLPCGFLAEDINRIMTPRKK